MGAPFWLTTVVASALSGYIGKHTFVVLHIDRRV